MKLSSYIRFWKLARKRLESPEDYLAFQRFQASLLIPYLKSHGIDLKNKALLDIGSGLGGYSIEFQSLGSNVTAVDSIARRLPRPSADLFGYVEADAIEMPFASGTFDFVFCASLIEHVANPALLLSEIERILIDGGHAYISFPPFLSPRGGHECSPFHYLGEELALRLSKREASTPQWVRDIYHTPERAESYDDLYQGCGLNKLSIYNFREMVQKSKMELISIGARYLPLSFVRWPIIGEFLTWHAQFLLKKRAEDRG